MGLSKLLDTFIKHTHHTQTKDLDEDAITIVTF